MYFPRRCAAWLGVLVAGFIAAGGCGVLNPSLLGALGQNTVTDPSLPEGYIMLLVMNRSAVSIQVTARITKENGTSTDNTVRVGPLTFFAQAQDCDVAAIDFDSFSDGTNITPANLGTLTNGQAFSCGSVIAITAQGAPPTFRVEVY